MRRTTIPLGLFFSDDGAGAGGDGGAAGGDPGAPSPTPGAPTGSVVPPPGNAPATPPPSEDGQPERVASLPQWAQKELAKARDDAAKARQTARDEATITAKTEMAKQVAEALGLTPKEGEKLDPDQLQKDLASAKAEQLADRRELAVYRVAPKDVDPARLLDSRRFLDALSSVEDPSDEKAVRAAVDAFVTDHAEYRVTPGRAPGASGSDHGRTPGEPPKKTPPSSIAEALELQYAEKPGQ